MLGIFINFLGYILPDSKHTVFQKTFEREMSQQYVGLFIVLLLIHGEVGGSGLAMIEE